MDSFLIYFRNLVGDFAGLQQENNDLRERVAVFDDLQQENSSLRERVDILADACSQHGLEFVSVTGARGGPIYSTGVGTFSEGGRPVDLGHYANGDWCNSIDELFDAEIHKGNQTYRVSEAERIVCTKVRRDFRHLGVDLVDLVISFDRNSVSLTVMFEVPRKETQRWTDLDIEGVAENPGKMEDLRDCQLVEDETILFSCVRSNEH